VDGFTAIQSAPFNDISADCNALSASDALNRTTTLPPSTLAVNPAISGGVLSMMNGSLSASAFSPRRNSFLFVGRRDLQDVLAVGPRDRVERYAFYSSLT